MAILIILSALIVAAMMSAYHAGATIARAQMEYETITMLVRESEDRP
jgi:hypothetical protein